jgi:hypothetical protein
MWDYPQPRSQALHTRAMREQISSSDERHKHQILKHLDDTHVGTAVWFRLTVRENPDKNKIFDAWFNF